VVTDKLLAKLDEERKEQDKGKGARLDRAAKMYAFAKGMGYHGAHIGGHGITCDMVEYIIDKGEEFASNWEELVAEFDFTQKDGFYLFQKDEKNGLNTATLAAKTSKPANPPIYGFSRLVHKSLFNPHSFVFKGLTPLAKAIDKGPACAALFTSSNMSTRLSFTIAWIAVIAPCLTPLSSARCHNARRDSAMAPVAAVTKVGVKSTQRKSNASG